MSTRALLGCLALIFILAAAAAVVRGVPYDTMPRHDAPPQSLSPYWQERVQARGVKEAYADFARYVEDMPPERQHEHAHTFGRALYSAAGEKALSTCDSRFSFGCFHEFLGAAIADLGIASVARLNDGCFESLKESPLSCQHGIGHGVAAYFGYDEAALRSSLEVCRTLARSDPIGGCYGGVFMEYNLQTMLGEEGRTRPFAEQRGEQFPCNALDQAFKPACYFWQPQWWGQVVRMGGETDMTRMYGKMGEWCSRAPFEVRRPCFEGMGNNVPPDADFVGAATRKLCEAASENARDQLYCKSYAANSLFLGGAGKKGDALAVCEGLEKVEYEYCAAYARNSANIAAQIELPE